MKQEEYWVKPTFFLIIEKLLKNETKKQKIQKYENKNQYLPK